MNDLNVLIDMDGVVADFTGHCLKLFAPHLKTSEITNWELCNHWGWTDDQLWEAIDKLGDEFWETIPSYPWHQELWDFAATVGRPLYCSSPSHSASATAGKQRWLQKIHGYKFEGFIFTKHKHLLTGKDTTLIDDKDGNVENWNARAKLFDHRPAIIFPRWWNKENYSAPRPMCWVADCFDGSMGIGTKEHARRYHNLHDTDWKGH